MGCGRLQKEASSANVMSCPTANRIANLALLQCEKTARTAGAEALWRLGATAVARNLLVEP